MIAVFSKKKLLSLIMLGMVGLVLLILGLCGGISWPTAAEHESQDMPATQVSEPVATSVKIDEGDTTAALPAVTKEENFFVDYRLERDRTRGQQVEWLREIINNTETADDTRQKAQESLLAISRNMEKESTLENLIRAKGFTDAAVKVDESTATAIVSSADISAGDIGVITELVARITGLSPDKIAVIGKE